MKDILLITNYWHFECEKASSRYRTLAEMIVQSDMKLEVVTSKFYHATKKNRSFSEEYLNKFRYRVTLVEELGYKKNISFKRLISSKVFAANVISYLKKRKKPDVIYVVVPSLDVADSVLKYANKMKIPCIIDIQDLWPEAFKMAINIPIISDVLFYPLKRKANRIYHNADEIIAVSETYVNRAIRYNNKVKKGLAVYIGTDNELIDNTENLSRKMKKSDEFWIAYIGSLGHSYDIKMVIDALKFINNDKIIFKIMGDGVLAQEYQDYAKKNYKNCDFTGFLCYSEMMKTLRMCDIAVNPINKNSVASIINKVSDYAIAGVPVINSQNSEEYRNLLNKYECGINTKPGDYKSMAEAIKKMYTDKDKLIKMKQNSELLWHEKFSRRNTYIKIIEVIRKLSDE